MNTARKGTNKLLQKARASRSDEFYTQRSDIDRELKHYHNSFRGKVVYCNCDDPNTSNFFRYFVDNFQLLGLKKVIASCYRERMVNLFIEGNDSHGFFCEYTGERDDNGSPILPKIQYFEYDGDFRGRESVELLKQSDVVVTNPPFSLFREYVAQLVKYDKRFLIIGNINAITYKEIFSLIQSDKVWLGVNLGRGISGFIVPEHYDLYGTEVHVNSKGEAIVSTNNCLWLTNMVVPCRNERLTLAKEYLGNEDKYLTYDNCDGINVNRTQDIPKDYLGLMGVPITFLHKYNPEQFEIIRFRKGDNGKDLSINGKCPYFRILIKRRQRSDKQY